MRSSFLYCWWKKSCTSWYGKYPNICRVSYMSGGAGFLPSTVSLLTYVVLVIDHWVREDGQPQILHKMLTSPAPPESQDAPTSSPGCILRRKFLFNRYFPLWHCGKGKNLDPHGALSQIKTEFSIHFVTRWILNWPRGWNSFTPSYYLEHCAIVKNCFVKSRE